MQDRLALRVIALDMTRERWVVFFAAWLGWGFDVFDRLLFNFVAPVCVPGSVVIAQTDHYR